MTEGGLLLPPPRAYFFNCSRSRTAPVSAEDALFADMGGQAGIDRLVDVSVDNYLADPRIKDIF